VAVATSTRGRLRTQYLEIDDAGSHAIIGSRPTWLWGFEHGVNDRVVATTRREGAELAASLDRPLADSGVSGVADRVAGQRLDHGPQRRMVGPLTRQRVQLIAQLATIISV
jgi:hypothetical protein